MKEFTRDASRGPGNGPARIGARVLVFGSWGFVDAFREVNQKPDQYTWWSNRGRAWDNNVGWRIDYQVVSADLRQAVSKAQIYTRKRFSDHAPLIMDYDFE